MTLNFYDDLGYSYTAKFAVRPLSTGNESNDKGKYTVELASLMDSNGKDYLEAYNATAQAAGGTTLTYDQMVRQYVRDAEGNILATLRDENGDPIPDADGNPTQVVVEQNAVGNWVRRDNGEALDPDLVPLIDDANGLSCILEFNTDNGEFVAVGGSDSIVLNFEQLLSDAVNEGSNFKDIEVDFSACLNLNNGGTSTMGALKGIDGDGAGKKLGALTGLSVDTSGKIFGSYDNGNTVVLCQIAVAQFSNASGLEKVGDNCYQTTLNSGDFDGIGVEIIADGSSISTGELEMSNVDLSAQFTDMIITQRGFQANSRVITTSDTLLEELINLKR